jgi:hypothetical protein
MALWSTHRRGNCVLRLRRDRFSGARRLDYLLLESTGMSFQSAPVYISKEDETWAPSTTLGRGPSRT